MVHQPRAPNTLVHIHTSDYKSQATFASPAGISQRFLTGPYRIVTANVWIIHGNGCFDCVISLNARKRSRETARLRVPPTAYICLFLIALRDRKFMLQNSSFPLVCYRFNHNTYYSHVSCTKSLGFKVTSGVGSSSRAPGELLKTRLFILARFWYLEETIRCSFCWEWGGEFKKRLPEFLFLFPKLELYKHNAYTHNIIN